jgi:hypothetical protein
VSYICVFSGLRVVSAVSGPAKMWGAMKIEELNRRGPDVLMAALAAFALGVTLMSTPALADDAAQPAARAIRLSQVEGQVQLSQGKQLLASPAVTNTPLFEGSLLTTGDDGRAEIQFEDGSVARLSPNSSMTLAVLRGQDGSSEAEIAIESGLGYFELQGGGLAGTIRVRFAGSVVTASGFTVLRINLDNAPGELAVFSGNAHLERGSAMVLDLHGGESVALNSADPSRYNLSESIEPDSWDTWNSDRDEALSSDAAARTGATNSFPDAGNPAWGDLDANGTWYNVPDQGYVWSPTDASNPGFDPYGNGNWMWTPGYDYIFVSGYSWGYTPFQCGTWNYFDAFGWGWAPGINGCRPWWGGGLWGFNLGILPPGYHGILRPPRHTPFRPSNFGGARPPVPMIAVNRHGVGSGNPLPSRDRTSVVSIAGYTVQALRPLSPRPQYDHSASGYVSRSVGSSGTSVHGFAAGTGSSRPSSTYSAPRSSSPPPASHVSGPSHAPSSAPSHVSSGGGGGGGGHPAPSGGGGHK